MVRRGHSFGLSGGIYDRGFAQIESESGVCYAILQARPFLMPFLFIFRYFKSLFNKRTWVLRQENRVR